VHRTAALAELLLQYGRIGHGAPRAIDEEGAMPMPSPVIQGGRLGRLADAVGAIYELAGGDEHEMERIWQYPTHQEINFVLSRVPEADHAEAFWGIDSLASIKKAC
jgi:hypothetical protein